ncbi:MAG TPA: pyrroline-5-carboxylate reductase [bacterium]|nr:pyrroline-5-carboxylate reductase [bacterium]
MIKRKKFQFGVIGCGNIGCAIASGLTKYARIPPTKICATECDISKALNFKSLFSIEILPLDILVKNSRFIILAVKPKDIPELCADMSLLIEDSSVVISVVAGITMDSLCDFFGKSVYLIRMMPNLAIETGKGLIGYCWKNTDSETLKQVIEIFSKTSFCFPVQEKDMFLVTAVSGSGPGFLFYFAEIIFQYLKEKRFDEETAQKITAALFEGSGILLAQSNQDPSMLKQRVCSPGGTTLAGLEKMRSENIEKILKGAFDAALKKAIELSK